MILIAGVLGLRWSEVTALRVGRIDLLRRTLRVVETNPAVGDFADTKSPSSRRTLSIPRTVADEIALHMTRNALTGSDGDALVFTSDKGDRLVYTNFHRRHWQKALQTTGITGFTFHGLRHASVAYLVAAGAHPKAIQQRLGHSSWSTTMDIYGHVLPANDDTITAALDQLLQTHHHTRQASERPSPSLKR
jgi:integrase